VTSSVPFHRVKALPNHFPARLPSLSTLVLHQYYSQKMDPHSPHFAIREPPSCLECGSSTIRKPVQSNITGNAGRPFYACANANCKEFSCFGDMRGVHSSNPACECPSLLHSRLQLAGDDGRQYCPLSLFYRCAVGRCNFFRYLTNEQGQRLVYTGPILASSQMALMGL
jgi:hypothetical protein